MRTKGNAFLVFVTIVSVVFVTVVQTLPPPALPADAPAAEFSAERAIDHIRVIATQPRPSGSLAYEAARDYVLAELQNLGLETETQRVGALQNTIGWIAGNKPSDIVLLTAHLDSDAESPGATDDGSGVAVLLETARALISMGPSRNTVMFLFTDCEEDGLQGARAFITHHPRAQDVKVVIGFDAGGLSGPSVLSATSSDNGWLIQQLAQADTHVTGSSAIDALADSRTDFGRGFRVAGFSGFAFDLFWDIRIHSPEDRIENLNPASIQHQGYHALSLARHFGNLDPLADPSEPDAVYFSVLRLFVLSYSSIWAIPLAVAVTGVFCGVLAYGLRRNILTWRGIGYGACALVAGLIIAPLPNILLGRWVSGVTSQIAVPSLVQPLEVSLIVLMSLALTILWYHLARRIRSTSLHDLSMGALVPMVAGLAGTAVAFPAISFAFTWPLLLSLMASANWFYWYARQKNSKTVIAGLLISGAANIVILGPSILLGLFDQMTLTLLFLGVLCGFLLPQIHLMLGCSIGNRN